MIVYHNQLNWVRSQITTTNVNCFYVIRKHMTHLLVKEDMFWLQRAKTHWLGDRNSNTIFFHQLFFLMQFFNQNKIVFFAYIHNL
jgi:hypothetical protein